MSRAKLTIQRSNGNLGRKQTTNDMITAVVMNAIATDEMILGTIYQLNSLEDVEALGLSADYDTTNKVLVYHRLLKMFFLNPSIVVHFMPVAQTVTMAQMADKANNYLAKILRDKAGAINLAMIALNPDDEYVATIETGLDSDSIAAMYKAQELSNHEFTKDRYCDFFIEGRAFGGNAAAILGLRTLEEDCPDCTMVILADNDVSLQDPMFLKYAAVEDVVALVSLAAVSQNAGELIDLFSLTNTANGFYLNAGLSSGTHINNFSDENLDLLDEKGYVFATLVPEIAGYHLNDTHTCTAITDDYAYVENNRTIKKAIRLARKAILPKVKSRFYVDPNTGKLKPEDAKTLEAETVESLKPLKVAGDISGGIDAFVDPNQNVLSSSELLIELTFVPVSIGRIIKLKIGFRNPFK